MTKIFEGSTDVAFMDVDLSQESIREGPNGEAWNPGAGGWPTVRYFNKETGLSGGTYVKKTTEAMCTELGDEERMTDMIEEYGNTSTCAVDTEKGCNDKEIGYIGKMKSKSNVELTSQLDRLEAMEGSSMTSELLNWLKKRKKILKQLVVASSAGGAEDEL